MAKRVIQMYDKYKSTTKTYPKIIKECLQKDVTDFIEGQVEANPTLAGTEASLTGLQIGDTKYKVPQGTTVIANPDPAGETALTGLQIGDTKYKVSGKQLYQHNIVAVGQSSGSYGTIRLYIDIINEDSNAFTYTKLRQYLIDKGFTSISNLYVNVRGWGNDTNETCLPCAIYLTSIDATNIQCQTRNYVNGNTSTIALRENAIDSFVDKVISL